MPTILTNSTTMLRQIPINMYKTKFRKITHIFEIWDIGTSVSVKTIQEGMTERLVTKSLSNAKKQNYEAHLTTSISFK